jgi:hypothetical protein
VTAGFRPALAVSAVLSLAGAVTALAVRREPIMVSTMRV